MTLSFDPASHTYRLDGIEIPSVSRILDDAGFNPRYTDGDYRERGSAVHKATVLIDQDKKFRADPRIDGYLESYRLFRQDWPVVWELTEVQAFHPTLVYAGTLDRGKRPLINRKGVICDIKTGTPPKKRLGLQTAAYAMLHWNGRPGYVDRMGVQLDKDGGRYKIHPCNDDQDYAVWIGLVHRWHWERKK